MIEIIFGMNRQGNVTSLDSAPHQGSPFLKAPMTLNPQICHYMEKFLSETTDPIQSKFAMEHEVDEFYWDFARRLKISPERSELGLDGNNR